MSLPQAEAEPASFRPQKGLVGGPSRCALVARTGGSKCPPAFHMQMPPGWPLCGALLGRPCLPTALQ